MPALAAAGTITRWTGTASSDWANAANWDAGVPAAGYVAAILDVTRNPVSLTTPATVDGLETGAANSLTLAGATLQTGALTNAGTITLAGGTLTLSGTGPFTSSGIIQNAAGGLSTLGGSLTNTGTISIADSSALQVTGGSTYTNTGVIQLNASGGGSALHLVGAGDVTLTGSGSLAMSNSLGNYIIADTPGLTLVNEAGHTIAGGAVIGGGGSSFTFRNAGTVTANGSAGIVFAPAATLVNTGTHPGRRRSAYFRQRSHQHRGDHPRERLVRDIPRDGAGHGRNPGRHQRRQHGVELACLRRFSAHRLRRRRYPHEHDLHRGQHRCTGRPDPPKRRDLRRHGQQLRPHPELPAAA